MTTFSGGGFYEKLGVRPFINLEGSLTLSGGFTPSPAVSAAMEEANARFCDMEHLLDGAGRFIADALGVEAAYVAPGGISALILSAAALMSGDDLELMRRLPDTEGMDNEFVVQASNKAAERAFEIAGGRVVYAGDDTGCTAAQLEAAIGPRTVAICQYFAPGDGVLPIEETRAVAQAHGIPLVVDGAATSRPLDLFRRSPTAATWSASGASTSADRAPPGSCAEASAWSTWSRCRGSHTTPATSWRSDAATS